MHNSWVAFRICILLYLGAFRRDSSHSRLVMDIARIPRTKVVTSLRPRIQLRVPFFPCTVFPSGHLRLLVVEFAEACRLNYIYIYVHTTQIWSLGYSDFELSLRGSLRFLWFFFFFFFFQSENFLYFKSVPLNITLIRFFFQLSHNLKKCINLKINYKYSSRNIEYSWDLDFPKFIVSELFPRR